ncbi:uncharacterized protein BO95DRAFT_377136, partial [Aspergillus brunneoviolaceus CBS 621.78]
MYRRLQKRLETAGLCERIKETCKGYLEWVFNLKPEAASSANVRIDGEIIKVGYSSTRVPNNNPTLMPYHIIKATEYLRVFHDLEDLEFVCKGLGNLCQEWFLQLNQTKNRRTPTWQHFQGSDVPYYRLGDHVWVWKALKGIEEVLNRLESHRQPCIERNIKRFTVRNEVFNKRMLSVTRSANETRFLLHSRDTVLYYGALWDSFEDQEDLLHEMLEIQTRHDDSLCDEVEWTNPLRYGLALLWSLQGYRLAWGKSSGQMVNRAKKFLLASSYPTGLFPGYLDAFKKAYIFETENDYDIYFHTGFEIAYILLKSLDLN